MRPATALFTTPYPQHLPLTVWKLPFAVGDVGKNSEIEYTVKHEEDPEKKIYKTRYYANGRLTGAILIGDTKEMQSVTEEMEQA